MAYHYWGIKYDTRHPAWAWDWSNKLPELYAPQVPLSSTNDLIPDRAPGPRRAAHTAYEIKSFQVELYADQVPNGVHNDLGQSIDTHSIPWRLWQEKYQRAPRTAYEIKPFQVELYGSQVPLSVRPLLPERAPGRTTARIAYNVYWPGSTDLYLPPAAKPIEIGTLLPSIAPGLRRAANDAYWLKSFQVELYGAQVPISIRSLIPDRALGPRRTANTAYTIPTNLVSLYAPAPAVIAVKRHIDDFRRRTLLSVRPRR